MERLQKVIAAGGVCSRRKAETLITEGRVRVNGEVVRELGVKVSSNDVVSVDGKKVDREPPVHYVFYKPEGCVSTTDDELGRKTVLDFIETDARIFPVGRLDYDTSGVLILSNDGNFTQNMLHPSRRIEKEYEVTIEGFLRRETSLKIEKGFVLDGEKTARTRIRNVKADKKKATTKLNIVVIEGRYHLVKRLFENFGHTVKKLKRIRFGIITLDGLARGDVRLLKPHEYKQLMHLAKQSK